MPCPLIKKNMFLNILKQQALAAFATCVLKYENRNMLLSKIYIKACRYYFSRFHSKCSHGLRYFSVTQNEILIMKIHHHSCLTDISRSIHNVNKESGTNVKCPILQTHITFVPLIACRSFAVQMIDGFSYSNLLIAGVIIFILIRMLNAAEALYRHVNESESCVNLKPVKLLNYLRY